MLTYIPCPNPNCNEGYYEAFVLTQARTHDPYEIQMVACEECFGRGEVEIELYDCCGLTECVCIAA